MERRVLGRSVALLFGVGFTIRLLLVVAHGPRSVEMVESTRVAVSLLAHGTFANAYGGNGGPTAHLMPLYPILLSVPIALFGTGNAGGIAVSALACATSAFTFALLPVLGRNLRFDARVGVIGGAIGELLPLNFWTQTSGTWEAPVTGLVLVALTTLIGGRFVRRTLSVFPDAMLIGIVAGLGVLLNAAIIPVLFGWMLVALRVFHSSMGTLARFALTVASIVALALMPWVTRNYRVFGHFVPTRTNLGLEVQVSNNDFAVADGERNMRIPSAFRHPAADSVEAARVRAVGELQYNRDKMAVATQWITTHRAKFARLTVTRFLLFWFPRMLRLWQSALQGLVTVAGLAALVLLIRRGDPAALVLGSVFAAYPLIYLVVQIMPRYRYPVEPLLALLAAWLVVNARESRVA